jgi:uncharacterized protein HemX
MCIHSLYNKPKKKTRKSEKETEKKGKKQEKEKKKGKAWLSAALLFARRGGGCARLAAKKQFRIQSTTESRCSKKQSKQASTSFPSRQQATPIYHHHQPHPHSKDKQIVEEYLIV